MRQTIFASNMLMARILSPDFRVGELRPQLLQQRLRVFQIARVETFSKPAKQTRERLSCFVSFPLTA